MKSHVSALCTLPLLLVGVFCQSLPYHPTTILSSNSDDIAYAFLPVSSSTSSQFVSLNISSTLHLSNFTLETITPGLLFFTSGDAYIPSISSEGAISVYTGSCNTSTSPALWRFTPSNTSSVGNGTWAQEVTNTAGDVTIADLPGADYLAGGFSFSTIVNANASLTKIYLFGGMCPTTYATSSTWQSAASYSNDMLRLAPSSSSATTTTYTLDVTSSRGPPIAEAGFTITGLTPTYSNASGILTQERSYVLVGGHTQTAFINMSQVAVWSLPEEAWSFVTVDSPSTSNANTELAIKSTVTSVDSRSGHTAVLSEDGGSIIVYGGWVGDLTQAADPQLAVLKLGTGYGGTGDWQWSIPSKQPSGNGIYGHGAVMLPGNVMMVLGGYNISSSANSKRATTSGQAMFFNATSMEWISDYTNPSYVAAQASESASAAAAASKKSNSTKIGLGVGLGVGFVVVIITILLCFFCFRRSRKRREAREEGLGHVDAGSRSFYHTPNGEMVQRGGFPRSNGRWNSNGAVVDSRPVYDSNSAVAGYESLHNLGDIGAVPPPPRQITRKPVHTRNNARGAYGAAPTSHEYNSNGLGPSIVFGRGNNLGTAGAIHPIYEADEDGNSIIGDDIGVAIGEPSFAPSSSRQNRYSDPFRDPPPSIITSNIRRENSLTSEAESPAESRQREIQEWVSDWAAADVLLNSQIRHSQAGRVSPTRRAQLIAVSQVTAQSVSGEEDSGRTESNLSERTDRSVAISAMSISRSGSSSQGRSRANSLRGLVSGLNPFGSSTHVASTTGPSTTLSPVFDGPGPHGPSYRPPGSAGSQSSKSFNTARTSFPALQAEGESLLPRPEDDISAGEYSPTRSFTQADDPGSPSKSKPMGLRGGRASWLGSLRRVFASDSPTGASSPEHSYSSRENSPVRYDYATSSGGREPRRTVSAGATLWRRKQGKSDWEDSANNSVEASRSNTFTGELSSPGMRGGAFDQDDYDEWDIERAVENRVVQVMFTVPKEKLRVVNHDFSDSKSEASTTPSGSLKSKKGSGKGSLKDLVMPPPPLMPAAVVEPLLEDKEEERNAEREEADNVDQKLKGKEVEMGPSQALTPSRKEPDRESSRTPSPMRKGKGRVGEIIDLLEQRNSPSPEH
ncbi:uncharacterized protein PAC_13958 [Phialocephala subalpina]|uniref:Galactose oxidase n=1 Tax=Phialocephala subalpina TaxID=576137 RepID=A0A1L7XG95_9HELO|nr:uncharacterized protein PAC_13958 [Phialocephala subalpina]